MNKEIEEVKNNEGNNAIKKAEIKKDIEFLESQIKDSLDKIGEKEILRKKTMYIKELEDWISNKFLEIVKIQNCKLYIIKHPEKYPKSKVVEYIYADKSGYITTMDNFQIGMSALELGAGRKTKEDKIEPKAGLIFKHKIGDKVKKGDVLVELRSESQQKINPVKENLSRAILLSDTKTLKPTLVKKVIK